MKEATDAKRKQLADYSSAIDDIKEKQKDRKELRRRNTLLSRNLHGLKQQLADSEQTGTERAKALEAEAHGAGLWTPYDMPPTPRTPSRVPSLPSPIAEGSEGRSRGPVPTAPPPSAMPYRGPAREADGLPVDEDAGESDVQEAHRRRQKFDRAVASNIFAASQRLSHRAESLGALAEGCEPQAEAALTAARACLDGEVQELRRSSLSPAGQPRRTPLRPTTVGSCACAIGSCGSSRACSSATRSSRSASRCAG